MKIVTLFPAALLGLALSTGYAIAGSDEHSSDYKMMMQERHQMMNDMMSMMKTTMGILRDLNHTPSAEQKKQLSEMMAKMDQMMSRHDEMHAMMKGMMQHKGKGGMGMGGKGMDGMGMDGHR